jgi:hypothetical protein
LLERLTANAKVAIVLAIVAPTTAIFLYALVPNTCGIPEIVTFTHFKNRFSNIHDKVVNGPGYYFPAKTRIIFFSYN